MRRVLLVATFVVASGVGLVWSREAPCSYCGGLVCMYQSDCLDECVCIRGESGVGRCW